jgi:TonB family protein
MKVSIVLLAALAACAVLRRQSAAVRHWVLAAAIVCAASIPVAERILPSWSVAVGAPAVLWRFATPAADTHASSRDGSTMPASEGRTADRRFAVTSLAARAAANPRTTDMLSWLWMAGTAASLLALFIGFIRLGFAAARADHLVAGTWARVCAEVAGEYGLTRPVTLLCGSHPGLLVTWGLLRPKILIPTCALTWEESRIRVVAGHELAHVARGDWITQLAAELLRCVYWFNPLAWIACRRLRRESEHAADDAVLLRGVRAADYAAHLLDLARSMTHHRRTWAAAPAVARPSSLERRINAMLNGHLDRQPISRAARLACGAVVVTLTTVVASLVFAQERSAHFTGAVSDPSGAPLPDTTMSLTHRSSGVTHAAPTDQTGAFAFTTLAPGEYLLEARAMGFAPVKDTITLAAGDNVRRDFRMNIGSIQETIHISGEVSDRPRSVRVTSDVRRMLNRFRGQRLQPPIKVNHIAPKYPKALLDGGVEGQVVLRGRVADDGSMTGIEVVTPAHADLVNAAIEAAQQWKFEPTRLWGTPVEVGINMTFNFRAQK